MSCSKSLFVRLVEPRQAGPQKLRPVFLPEGAATRSAIRFRFEVDRRVGLAETGARDGSRPASNRKLTGWPATPRTAARSFSISVGRSQNSSRNCTSLRTARPGGLARKLLRRRPNQRDLRANPQGLPGPAAKPAGASAPSGRVFSDGAGEGGAGEVAGRGTDRRRLRRRDGRTVTSAEPSEPGAGADDAADLGGASTGPRGGSERGPAGLAQRALFFSPGSLAEPDRVVADSPPRTVLRDREAGKAARSPSPRSRDHACCKRSARPLARAPAGPRARLVRLCARPEPRRTHRDDSTRRSWTPSPAAGRRHHEVAIGGSRHLLEQLAGIHAGRAGGVDSRPGAGGVAGQQGRNQHANRALRRPSRASRMGRRPR